jgi:hypothetical protein
MKPPVQESHFTVLSVAADVCLNGKLDDEVPGLTLAEDGKLMKKKNKAQQRKLALANVSLRPGTKHEIGSVKEPEPTAGMSGEGKRGKKKGRSQANGVLDTETSIYSTPFYPLLRE